MTQSARLPTTGYARALKIMFIWRELGGTGTGCLFQFTYCEVINRHCTDSQEIFNPKFLRTLLPYTVV